VRRWWNRTRVVVWAVASEHEEAAAVDVANPMIVGDVVGRSDGRSDGGVCAWHGKGPRGNGVIVLEWGDVVHGSPGPG